jgi:hypothetical protein
MFKILRLWRQRCHIKRKTGLPKTWGRERAENKNPGGGGGYTCNARVGPTTSCIIIQNLNVSDWLILTNINVTLTGTLKNFNWKFILINIHLITNFNARG